MYCIYVFYVILKIGTHYFHKNYEPFHHEEGVYFLRVRN